MVDSHFLGVDEYVAVADDAAAETADELDGAAVAEALGQVLRGRRLQVVEWVSVQHCGSLKASDPDPKE